MMRAGRTQPGSRPPRSFARQQQLIFIGRLARNSRAVSAVEYALIVALIGVSILAATMRLGNSVQNTFNNAEAAQKSGDTFNVL
jgi:Flp pilus assembly pilin Flp